MTTSHPDRSDPEVRSADKRLPTWLLTGLSILVLVAVVVALHLLGVIGG